MTTEEALTILSRHGWDRAGTTPQKRGPARWEFRHAGSGDVLDIAPGEVVMWAAQIAPALLPQASPDDDWYVEGYLMGFWFVKSRSGKKSGYECKHMPAATLFSMRRDADRAVLLLNARDSIPIQMEMAL